MLVSSWKLLFPSVRPYASIFNFRLDNFTYVAYYYIANLLINKNYKWNESNTKEASSRHWCPLLLGVCLILKLPLFYKEAQSTPISTSVLSLQSAICFNERSRSPSVYRFRFAPCCFLQTLVSSHNKERRCLTLPHPELNPITTVFTLWKVGFSVMSLLSLSTCTSPCLPNWCFLSNDSW